MNSSLILASSSPRRKEILTDLGFAFSIVQPPYDESLFEWAFDWKSDIQEIAKKKVMSVDESSALVLGADTVVVTTTLEGKEIMLGKPRDFDQALHFLALLQGRVHCVYSGVALRKAKRVETSYSLTRVKIRSMTLEQQVAYLNRINPLDKAGAFAVQNEGAIAIEWIEGSDSNVRGLPINALHSVFQSYGIDLYLLPPSLKNS